VLVAGPTDVKVALRAIRFVGGVWTYLNASGSGPHVVCDATNESDGVLLPVVGDWFTIDAEWWVDNVFVEWVTVDGDDATPLVIGNIYIDCRTSAAPPASETPTPGIPASVYAYWALTEGSGQSVANKSPGVAVLPLQLGSTAGVDGNDPTWQTGPRRLEMGGGTTTKDLVYALGIPSVAAGSALFFYGQIDALGTAVKYLCAIDGGGVDDHQITVSNTTGLASVYISENTGGGTNRTATGTTVLNNGEEHVFGFVHDGSTLKLYIDPIDGLEEASVACAAAQEPGGRNLILGSGGNPPAADNGPDNFDLGDSAFWAGATVPTPAEIAELYAAFKLTYTGLP
jgi:hypothetical protein